MISRRKKMVAYTFLPTLDNANGRLKKERKIVSQQFCCHDNMTLHFPLLRAAQESNRH